MWCQQNGGRKKVTWIYFQFKTVVNLRDVQIKATVRDHLTPVRMAIIKKSIVLKCPSYPKWSKVSMQSQSKFLSFFAEIGKSILKFKWNLKELWIAKNNLRKEQSWKLILPNLKTCYKATVIQTVWCWNTDRHVKMWNRILTPEINS